jgi:hypothetical protein
MEILPKIVFRFFTRGVMLHVKSNRVYFITGGRYMKKKGKSPSLDLIMRFVLQRYNIPTRQDIEKLGKRMERLEELLKANRVATGTVKKAGAVKGTAKKNQARRGRAKMTATEKILSIIRRSAAGADISVLKAKTGFEDKKIRNIVFRLTKQGTIKRAGRGVYAAQ